MNPDCAFLNRAIASLASDSFCSSAFKEVYRNISLIVLSLKAKLSFIGFSFFKKGFLFSSNFWKNWVNFLVGWSKRGRAGPKIAKKKAPTEKSIEAWNKKIDKWLEDLLSLLAVCQDHFLQSAECSFQHLCRYWSTFHFLEFMFKIVLHWGYFDCWHHYPLFTGFVLLQAW